MPVAVRLRVAPLAALVLACAPQPGTGAVAPPDLPGGEPVDPAIAALIEELRAGVAAAPRDAGAWLELGLAFRANGFDAQAEETLMRCTELDAGRDRAWYHLARARAELGQVDDALAALDRALEIRPEMAALYWRKGIWLLDAGRLDGAEQAFRTASDLVPGASAAIVGLARVALQRGDGAGAVELLERAREMNPDSGYVRQLLGTALRDAGDLDAARRVLRGASGEPEDLNDPWEKDLDPYRAGYWQVLEGIKDQIAAGRLDEALADLEPIRRAHPWDLPVVGALAAVLSAGGEHAKAIALLEEALERIGDHYRLELSLALVLKAQGDLPRALASADRAIELNPAFGPAHGLRGWLLVRLDRPAEALEAYERALRLGESELSVLLATAMLQADAGRPADAERTLERATLEHPAHPRPFVILADLLIQQGDLERAAAALRSARELDQNDPFLPRVEERLAAVAGAEGDG